MWHMVSPTSKNCRANYRFSLVHFTLLLFYVSVGSTEQKCLSVTTLSCSDDLSTSLGYCSYCLYCSYCSLGKGAMKPSDALRAASEYDHGLSIHGFGAAPQSKEELKADSTIGLQPTKGPKAPRGSVSQHSSAYVGWKGSDDLNHSSLSWHLTTEEKHALAVIATSCCNGGAADVINNCTHTYSPL